jgi:metal-responsive CopG/Arc/MetJ family transcriptional regulator
MNILFNLPDNLADKLDILVESKGVSRAEFLRAVVCKLIGEPIPQRKKAGRRPKAEMRQQS